MAEKKLSVVITGDAKGAQHAFSSVSASASSADSKLSKVGGTIGKVFKGIAIGGGIAAVGVGAMVMGGIDALIELERIGAQTEAVIKSTGGAAGRTAEQISALAGSMEKATGVEQELIQQGQNMLLTFTNIQGTNFDAATQTMLDMSVAMGTDASTTAMQLGKALNDPLKGISALSKVGVTFTDQQKEQIKAMVAVGDTAGAQKVILAELNKEFGGSAAAFGDTTAGKVAKLKNAFGDLQEEIASRLLPVIEDVTNWLVANMPKAMEMVRSAMDRLAPTFDSIGRGAVSMVEGLKGIGESLAPALGAIAGFVKSNPAPVLAAVGAVAAVAFGAWAISAGAAALATLAAIAPVLLIGAAIALLAGGIVYAYQNFEGFRTVVDNVATFIRDVAFPAITQGIQRVWETIQTVIGVIKAAWQQWGDELLAIASAAWAFIRTSVENAIRVVQGVIQTVMSAIHGDWSGAWDGIKNILGGVWAQIRNVVSTGADALRAVLSAAWDAMKSAAKSAWEALKRAVSDGINEAVAVVRGFPGKVLAAIGNLASTLYNAGRELISGLVRGIRSAIPDITNVLSSVTNMIPDWKGPASKDRVLLHDNGRLIMAGLVGGLVAGESDVASYLTGLTEQIPKMVGKATKGPGGGTRGPSYDDKGPRGPGSDNRGPSSGTKEWAQVTPVAAVTTAVSTAAAEATKESAFDLTDVGQILERGLKAQAVLQKSTTEGVMHLQAINSTSKIISQQLTILNSSGRVNTGAPVRAASASGFRSASSAGGGNVYVNIHPNAVRGDGDIRQIVDGINRLQRGQTRPVFPAGVAG